ncbi:hypothetical protein B0J17DRAFT_713267 [Rhizoctonia solani]|nr:hypothetical protein B0J17DRAFT_713267 [Rhizoctonia solani]
MFTLAQPACHFYNPYEELAIQQELQRRRQMEAYLRRQRETEEMERLRREYEASVRAEYERRREAELERLRQAELQRRRQAQQARATLTGDKHPVRSHPLLLAPCPPRSCLHTRPCPTAEPEPTPGPQVEELQVDTTPSYAAVQSILPLSPLSNPSSPSPLNLTFYPILKLAYTPNNAPLHGYEHALTGLLTRLDAVESYGDDGVRRARKEAVKTIERALERLDEMKAEIRKRASEPEPKVTEPVEAETSVDPVYVPLPEDCDMEDAEMEGAPETITSGELPVADQLSTSAPTDSDPTEPTTLPDEKSPTPSEQSSDTNPTPISPAPVNRELALPNERAPETPVPHTPNPEPLSRSLTSPSSSEMSESDSDSELELEEYVDVETMCTSEDESSELEVDKDGDLELMHSWDLDF